MNTLKRLGIDIVIVVLITALFITKAYEFAPPALQLLTLKMLIVSMAVMHAHIVGKLLFGTVAWDGGLERTTLRDWHSMLRFLFVTLLAVNAFGADRCASLVQETRRAHWAVFGTDYPYQYGVAQLKQESNCRDIISNDGVGSQGVAQITYRWWQDVLKKNGINEIKSMPNHLRAQAVIMKSLYKPEYGLWVTYQIYNGGGHVLKEIARAGKADWEKAKEKCQRGRRASLCEMAQDNVAQIAT